MDYSDKIKKIFDILNIQDPQLLGEGGESQVFDYSNNSVLKIFKNNPDQQEIERLSKLYSSISENHLNFSTPEIIEVKTVNGITFSIEKKLKGKTIDKIYKNLNEKQRKILLTNFFYAVDSLSQIELPKDKYGQILVNNAQSEDWRSFIFRNAQSKAAVIKQPLKEDGIYYNNVIVKFEQDIKTLTTTPTKSLIHGDYFFENVMINENLEITAVFDFGWWSCIGDHLMDIAGAIMFLDLYEYISQEDKKFITNLAITKYGKDVLKIINIYRMYYSLLLTDCKESDTRAYNWSIMNLKEYISII